MSDLFSIPGKDLVSEPASKGAQDQQEETPAAGFLYHYANPSHQQ